MTFNRTDALLFMDFVALSVILNNDSVTVRHLMKLINTFIENTKIDSIYNPIYQSGHAKIAQIIARLRYAKLIPPTGTISLTAKGKEVASGLGRWQDFPLSVPVKETGEIVWFDAAYAPEKIRSL